MLPSKPIEWPSSHTKTTSGVGDYESIPPKNNADNMGNLMAMDEKVGYTRRLEDSVKRSSFTMLSKLDVPCLIAMI